MVADAFPPPPDLERRILRALSVQISLSLDELAADVVPENTKEFLLTILRLDEDGRIYVRVDGRCKLVAVESGRGRF